MNLDERKKARATLKSYFVKNAIPTEDQFAQLIDGGLNQRDDGLVKPVGGPLSIEAVGDATSPKRALDLYLSFADNDPAWSVALRPRRNPADPNSGRLGFSINDTAGNSRLCIDGETGRVGIGTTTPSEPLEVNGRLKAGDLSIGPWPTNATGYVFVGTNALNQASATNYALLQGIADGPGRTFLNSPVDIRFRIANIDRMVLTNKGDLGVGTGAPAAKLDVDGDVAIRGRHALRGNDPWLRLNQDGAFTAGVHTPGLFAPVSLNVGGVNGWGNPGAGNAWIAGDVAVGGKHALRGNDPWLRLNQDGAFTAGVHTPGLFAPVSLNVGGVNGWGNPGAGNAWIAGTLDVKGNIMPSAGAGENAGILFPRDPGGGGSDRAWMRYYPRSGEAMTLEVGISNDADDLLTLSAPARIGMQFANGTLNFTSAWQGTPDAVTNISEISNDIGVYKTLMIIGNKSAGMGRRVSVWDRFEVNGTFVNNSSIESKQDVQELHSTDYADLLDIFEQTPLFRYRFRAHGIDSKIRLGVIAEQSPIDILDETGKCVSILDYIGFLFGALKAQREEIKALAAKLRATECL